MLTGGSRVCLVNVNLHNGIPSAEVTSEHRGLNQVYIDQVSHCDGFLLCSIAKNTIVEDARIIVWNPCNGQIKWIQTRKNSSSRKFVLGYYQDNKSWDKSYKILDYNCSDRELELYDMNSNSWRNLGVTLIPDYHIVCSSGCSVSLKGKPYWCAYDSKEKQLGLISFDYTRERFERLRLPYQCDRCENLSLSVVGEERLSVLQREKTSRKVIWVTNKIDDETKELSWSKLLELKDNIGCDAWLGPISFLVDEEKKIVVCCDLKIPSVITVFIVGEDSNATPRFFPVKNMSSYWKVVDYVPSLIQFL